MPDSPAVKGPLPEPSSTLVSIPSVARYCLCQSPKEYRSGQCRGLRLRLHRPLSVDGGVGLEECSHEPGICLSALMPGLGLQQFRPGRVSLSIPAAASSAWSGLTRGAFVPGLEAAKSAARHRPLRSRSSCLAKESRGRLQAQEEQPSVVGHDDPDHAGPGRLASRRSRSTPEGRRDGHISRKYA